MTRRSFHLFVGLLVSFALQAEAKSISKRIESCPKLTSVKPALSLNQQNRLEMLVKSLLATTKIGLIPTKNDDEASAKAEKLAKFKIKTSTHLYILLGDERFAAMSALDLKTLVGEQLTLPLCLTKEADDAPEPGLSIDDPLFLLALQQFDEILAIAK